MGGPELSRAALNAELASQFEIPWVPSAPLYNRRRTGQADVVL